MNSYELVTLTTIENKTDMNACYNNCSQQLQSLSQLSNYKNYKTSDINSKNTKFANIVMSSSTQKHTNKATLDEDDLLMSPSTK